MPRLYLTRRVPGRPPLQLDSVLEAQRALQEVQRRMESNVLEGQRALQEGQRRIEGKIDLTLNAVLGLANDQDKYLSLIHI